MSTILSAPAATQNAEARPWTSGLLTFAKRRWTAYITWRVERAAAAQLWSMSDRQLKDIGLIRENIENALKTGERTRR